MRELVKFTDAELEQLADILGRSPQAQTIPDEYAADLREIFITIVADCAGRFRASIPYERALAKGAESAKQLKKIASRAEALERGASALMQILSTLDERTGAALHARISVEESPRAITTAAQQWLVEGHNMRKLATLAKAARGRYPARRGKGGRWKGVPYAQPYHVGDTVRALFARFSIPYSRTAFRGETASDSDAVTAYRIVTGMAGVRVEHYLPQ